jgi:hypothetical protein
MSNILYAFFQLTHWGCGEAILLVEKRWPDVAGYAKGFKPSHLKA